MKNWKYINGAEVGNARYTLREDVISHLDTDLYDICKKVPAGSPSVAYVSELQKKGWDMSTISKYNKEIGQIIDKYKARSSNVGNAKDKNGKELRTGDDVSIKTDNPKLNKGTVVRINGETVEVQVWGAGGSVWTTPSRLVTKVGNELNTGDFFKRLAADAHKEETRDNEKLNENGIKRAYAAMKKIGNSVHNLFLKFPSYEEAEDYINTKLKNKYKSVKVISKPHNGNGTYEIVAED